MQSKIITSSRSLADPRATYLTTSARKVTFKTIKTIDYFDNKSKLFDKINKHLEKMKNISKSEEDALEKGKRANIGETRDWKGGKFRKTANGWEPVVEGGYKGKKEESDSKDTLDTTKKLNDLKLKRAKQLRVQKLIRY